MKILRLLIIFCLLANPCFGAVNFDGTDDALVFAVDDTILRENQAFTISAWIMPRTTGGGGLGCIVGRHSGGEVRFKMDNLGGGSVCLGLTILGGVTLNRVTVNGGAVLNRWQHVLVTNDGTGLATGVHIYRDGIEFAYATSANNTTPTDNSAGALRIGSNNGTTRVFDGFISEVAIWDSVLPLGDIKKLASGVRRVPLQTSVAPKRYFPLDDFGNLQAIPTTAGLIRNRAVGIVDNGTQSGGATGRGDFISYP